MTLLVVDGLMSYDGCSLAGCEGSRWETVMYSEVDVREMVRGLRSAVRVVMLPDGSEMMTG